MVTDHYDPDFDKAIRDARPDWFNTAEQEDKAAKLLARLIKNPDLDPKLYAQLKQQSPHWFENTAYTKKEQLLEMAKNGEPRPMENQDQELKTLAYILYLLDSKNDQKAEIRHLVIELIKEKGNQHS